MWPFRKRIDQPPKEWAGPDAFFDWTEADIDAVSAAIREHGQPESDGFRTFALVALNTLRGGAAVELVARAMDASANPGLDPDRPIMGNHYMCGMPSWCAFAEYARPAVAALARRKEAS